MLTTPLASLLAVLALTPVPARPTIHFEPGRVRRGHDVRVFGAVPGCPLPDSVILISPAFSHAKDFAGLPAVYASLKAGSRYSIKTRIPARRRPGRYTVTGRCGGGNIGVSDTLRVLR